MATTTEQTEKDDVTPASGMTMEMIQRRAAGGMLSLALRRVIHQMISFSGGIALARILNPAVFGVFGIVTYVVNFFGFFADIGLGAAVVQMKDKPSERVLRTIFAIQMGLATILAVMIFYVAPVMTRKYALSESSMWLFRALSLSLFLTSMRVIPSTMLQRRLDFNRIIIPEIAEVITFQSIAVAMAYTGYGVWSLVCATLARALVGFTLMFSLSPWKVGFALDREVARKLIKFGGPYQLGQFFLLIKFAATPIFAGAMCGKQAVGYLSWAWGLALLPFAVTEIVGRVAFPALSRMQHDEEALARSIEKNVRITAVGLFPIATTMIAVAPFAVQHVYSLKWMPAVPALCLFLLSMMGTPVTSILSNAFYAMGMPKTGVRLTAIYVFLGWALNVPLVLYGGYTGIAWSAFIVGLVCIWLPIREMNKVVPVRIFRNIWAPLMSSWVAMVLTRWVALEIVTGVFTLVLVTLLGIALYASLMILLEGGVLRSEARSFLEMLKGPVEPAVVEAESG